MNICIHLEASQCLLPNHQSLLQPCCVSKGGLDNSHRTAGCAAK